MKNFTLSLLHSKIMEHKLSVFEVLPVTTHENLVSHCHLSCIQMICRLVLNYILLPNFIILQNVKAYLRRGTAREMIGYYKKATEGMLLLSFDLICKGSLCSSWLFLKWCQMWTRLAFNSDTRSWVVSDFSVIFYFTLAHWITKT